MMHYFVTACISGHNIVSSLFLLTLLMCVHLSVSSVCVTVAILTAATHHVQLCVLSTATDTTTPSMALSTTTTLTVRSICSK